MEEQSIRFTTVDGGRVAWATVGAGPPLVLGGWWMSHLDLNWRDQAFRELILALAAGRTVIRYDAPGMGLSEPGEGHRTLEREAAVLAAVVDACGAETVDFLAASAGGPIVAAYAAGHPERVGRLVFYGSYVRGAEVADAAARESILAMVRRHWGLGSRVLADVFMPSASAAQRREFVEFQRRAADAELAARSLEAVYEFDASGLVGRLTGPEWVLHRREDRAIPFRLGQQLAAALPDAAFQALAGADHLPWVGDRGELVAAVLGGLGPASGSAVPTGSGDLAAGSAAAAAASGLTAREIEVLRLVALGLSDREIAERLVLSPHTVHRHVANIRTKLRLPSRAAAAAQAGRLGLL